MRVYADHPERFQDLLPDLCVGSRRDPTSLPSADRALWSALSETDRPSAAEVKAPQEASLWRTVVAIAEAPRSQFDALVELMHQGADLPEAVAAVALTGRDHHGQRGRSWAVARGNLHLSVALPVGLPAARILPALTVLPAVAVVDAVRKTAGGALEPRIKWVNDIAVGHRKLAGVIATTQSRGTTVESAVLGIGINVAEAPTVPPTPSVPAVGCLADELAPAAPPSLSAVLWATLEALAARYQELARHGPDAVVAEYRRLSAVVGRQVRIYADPPRPPGQPEEPTASELLAVGTVERIEPDLSLRLVGQVEPVRSGRLVFEEIAQQMGLD